MNTLEYPAFLEEAFAENYQFEDVDGTICICRTYETGELTITDGKVYAFDALTNSEAEPYENNFPEGNFKVELSIADFDGDERVAFARILFKNTKPVRWEMAVVPGQNLKELEPGDFYGYPVDSAVGSFMDTKGYDLFIKYSQDESFFEEVSENLDESYVDTWTQAHLEEDGGNMCLFSTGFGDGVFGSYIGYDQNNEICRLVTDFALIDWPE